jgi:hypothetical protein
MVKLQAVAFWRDPPRVETAFPRCLRGPVCPCGLAGRRASARESRKPVVKLPPFSAERIEELIHEFPPLRPVAGTQERPETRQRPRKPATAPTLEEAPRRPYDAPTLAEMEPPPQSAESRPAESRPAEAGTAEPKPAEPRPGEVTSADTPAETIAHEAAFLSLPEGALSPLAEIYALLRENVARSGDRALDGLLAALRSRKSLEDYLWSLQPAAAFAREVETIPPSAAQGGDEAAPSTIYYLLGAGVLLAGLLVIARIRVEAKKEEETPPPAVDLSRFWKTVRAAPSAAIVRAGVGGAARRATNERPRATAPVAERAAAGAAPPGPAAAQQNSVSATDDFLLVEPGDAAANSAALDAARTRQEGEP